MVREGYDLLGREALFTNDYVVIGRREEVRRDLSSPEANQSLLNVGFGYLCEVHTSLCGKVLGIQDKF